MSLYLSPSVRAKLRQPDRSVTESEILECFASRERSFLIDNRPEHQTPIPTQWFVAETNFGRVLKVVFIYDTAKRVTEIKTAYAATAQIQDIYLKYSNGI